MADLHSVVSVLGRLILACFFFTPVAAIRSITIDDSLGDSVTGQRVVYSPSTAGVWNDQNCGPTCAIRPDISKTFAKTYTAATYRPALGPISITLQFTGTGIGVYFILVNKQGPGITTMTMADFTLDGNFVSTFKHTQDETTDILYNSNVFLQNGLSNTTHTLVISVSDFDFEVYLNFDYAIYSQPDDVTTSPSTTSTSSDLASKPLTTSTISTPSNVPVSAKSRVPIGAIVGGVIGGMLVIFLLVFFLWWRRNRKLGRKIDAGDISNPFPHHDITGEEFPHSNPPTSRGQLAMQSHPPLPVSYNTHSEKRSQRPRLGQMGHIPRGSDLTPPSSTATGPSISSSTLERTRTIRQNEIDQRLRRAQEEITNLESMNAGNGDGMERSGDGNGRLDMAVHLRNLREQIAFLQSQQTSSWAMGLSDDLPPGYSPACETN